MAKKITKEDTKTKQLKEDKEKLNESVDIEEEFNEIWHELGIISEELERINNLVDRICDRMGLE